MDAPLEARLAGFDFFVGGTPDVPSADALTGLYGELLAVSRTFIR